MAKKIKKKYGLKCFGCGEPFYSKEDVYRCNGNYPYCGECAANIYGAEQEIYEERKFFEQFPTEQDYIDYKNLQKYGEC